MNLYQIKANISKKLIVLFKKMNINNFRTVVFIIYKEKSLVDSFFILFYLNNSGFLNIVLNPTAKT